MDNERYEIAYATYLGGSGGEEAREAIPYPDGSVLVGGQTNSSDFPTTPGVVQPEYAGDDPALGHPGVYGGDCFLARIGPEGEELLAATYFGGSRQERSTYGLLLDSAGNVVVSSATRSPDMPTTAGCYRPEYSGGSEPTGHDGFVATLTADFRKVLWCTYLGGCWPRGGIALDADDNVYVTGGTENTAFPTTAGALKRKVTGRNAVVVKLKADGSDAVWSTLLGGSTWDGCVGVQVDAAGDVYVSGHTRSHDFPVTEGVPQARREGKSDAFVAKLSGDASALVYSTLLGGGENQFAEHRLCLCPDGSVLTTGVTRSPDFPTTPGAAQTTLKGRTDGFLTKVAPDGARFVFSTLLGGSGGEFYLMPTLDPSGNIYIVGQSSSRDFPVTSDAVQTEYGGGDGDGVLAVLSPDGGEVLYATYLGGSGVDLIRSVALGPDGAVYLVGKTSSPDFPATDGVLQPSLRGKMNAFVVKLMPAP